MKRHQVIVTIVIVLAFLGVISLAVMRSVDESAGQVVPPGTPVTTLQPTVPCTTIQGSCGPSLGTGTTPFAYVNRYCNGDAVATPPGMTTYSLVYGIGGQTPPSVFPDGIGTFFGTMQVNGVEVPTTPLATLSIGERDVRTRQAVVDNDDVILISMVVVNGTDPAVNRVPFGNGQTVKTIEVSGGGCPAAVPPGSTPVTITPDLPAVNTFPPDAEVPPAL